MSSNYLNIIFNAVILFIMIFVLSVFLDTNNQQQQPVNVVTITSPTQPKLSVSNDSVESIVDEVMKMSSSEQDGMVAQHQFEPLY